MAHWQNHTRKHLQRRMWVLEPSKLQLAIRKVLDDQAVIVMTQFLPFQATLNLLLGGLLNRLHKPFCCVFCPAIEPQLPW